jgi:lipopolysaccharide export system protein LptA
MSSQAHAQRDGQVVTLDHADSLVGLTIRGERARELIGNVMFSQGTIVVRCTRAIQYLESNRFELLGGVDVRDGSLSMKSPRGSYDGSKRIAEAFDGVTLVDSSTTVTSRYGRYHLEPKIAYFKDSVTVQDTSSILTADELTHYREEQRVVAVGNVEIRDPKQSFVGSGQYFESRRPQSWYKLEGSPRIVQYSTAADDTQDTLTVRGRVLESFQDSIPRLIATDSVRITHDGLAAVGGSCVYYTSLDSMILRQSPWVWYTTAESEENQVFGDSIFVALKQRRPETVYVRGRAFAASQADTTLTNRYNQLSGQRITMHFANSKIRQIVVDQTATSLYYLFDESGANGLNRTSGDRVTMAFGPKGIDSITVTNGVEGLYVPEKMVKGHEESYQLQGFRWRNDRPTRDSVTVP